MKPYVVFLNGPPGSGKDFAANILMQDNNLHIEAYKFAYPLKRIASILLGVSLTWIENNKNTVIQPYNVTVRQMLIDISEKWMKPCYGNDIFGLLCRDSMAAVIEGYDKLEGNTSGDGAITIGMPDAFVISDSGFDKEALSVLQLFGNENALLIRLHRDGHSFEGDSRSYIELDDVHTIDLHNNGDSSFGEKLVLTVKKWMETHNER